MYRADEATRLAGRVVELKNQQSSTKKYPTVTHKIGVEHRVFYGDKELVLDLSPPAPSEDTSTVIPPAVLEQVSFANALHKAIYTPLPPPPRKWWHFLKFWS